MMRILVNAIPLTGLLTGISRYVRQLYQEIETFPDVEVFYFDGKRVHSRMPDQAAPEKWIRDTATIWKLPVPVVFTIRSLFWLKYEWMLRRVCRSGRFDLYHETGFLPAALEEIPTVYTMHDLSLSRYRHTHPLERVWFNEVFFPRRIRYAAHLLTVSQFVRSEIIEALHLPATRITAIHHAPAPLFQPRSAEGIRMVRERFGISGDYLLFVGSLEPRKNLHLLIQALRNSSVRPMLVLAGWEGWGDKGWLQSVAGSELEKRIVLTGYVDDETLACLYSGAAAFVYPSLYEGFGLPILEAMACGCPVICSRAASMPEVAGDAALLIDPADADDLKASIERLMPDEVLRNRMRERGFARVREFSWRKAAECTVEVFRRVIEG